MTMPGPSTSWNRRLPKPSALLDDQSEDPFKRQINSLLQHHIVTDKYSAYPLDGGAARRNTVPSISYHETPRTAAYTDNPSAAPRSPVSTDQSHLGPISRKRIPSLMADDLYSSGSSSNTQNAVREAAGHFCLCQPEPKIPRPRNAFILYRQHHQAAVVAQNPGFANPDISKIIGEQWRELSPERKIEWKALAEEEKARHQQQYPEYRYQPRRSGRNGNTSNSIPGASSPTVDASGNCIRCSGKTMNPPGTPSARFPPRTPVTSAVTQNGTSPTIRHAYAASNGLRSASQMGFGTLSPPTSARVRPYPETFVGVPIDPRIRYGPGHGQSAPLPASSDLKRRRFNENGAYIPNRTDMSPETSYQYSPHRASISRPEVMHPSLQQPQSRVTVGPPPRGASAHPSQSMHVQQSPLLGKHDPSLTLPPLQTQMLSLKAGPTSASARSQRSGVEAMIMSIPVLNKIQILGKVAPFLAAPGPATPAFEVRGAIIAVEGMDVGSVRGLTAYLAAELEKSGDFVVRSFEGPDYGRKDSETTAEFLKTISDWHAVSKEMVSFITTRLRAKSDQIARDETQRNNQDGENVRMSDVPPAHGEETRNGNRGEDDASSCSAVSPKTIIPQTQHLTLTSPAAPSSITTSVSSKRTRPPIPIALIPRYQLTTVDAASISLPINDSYSPLDHWQWLATLWRGCIGPDITIVVKGGPAEVAAEEGVSSIAAAGGVEVRLADMRTIVVRRGRREPLGMVDEKALRRVGFEVEEFLKR